MKDIYSLNLKKLEKLIFFFLIFLLPSQLAYHFWPEYSFIFGVRVDYLAPAVYLTDLLVLVLVAISRTKVKTAWLFAVGVFAFVNILGSISPWVSFWKWLKIFELIFFAKYIFDNKTLFKTKTFAKVFSASLILISLIGITQFLVGRTIGQPFNLLGERSFNVSTPGIALQEISGRQYLRAYSIFSHPNSFAGFLFISTIMFFPLLKKSVLFFPTILLSLIAILLTFSLSAFSGALLGFPLLFTKLNLNAPEVSERLQLINISKEVIVNNFWTGTGLGTFAYSNVLMQPVHNIFLLAASETGMVGLIGLCLLLYKLLRKNWYIFAFVLITGLLDHYWLTLQQNVLLLSLVFGFIF